MLPTRLLYGAVAMSAGVFVFSFLQEREELEDQEIESAERSVSSERFFQAMENMQLTPQERLEMRRFWRNLCKKQRLRSSSSDSSIALDGSQTEDDAADDLVVRDVQLFAQEYKRVFPDIFPEKQVLDAAEKAAEAGEGSPTAWNGIVGSTSAMIVSTGKRLNHIAQDTKGEVQSAMHRTVRKVLESALDIVASRLKQTLKDPDMPSYLKTNIDIGIEQFMPDVKMEIFKKTRELFGQDAPPNEVRSDANGEKTTGGSSVPPSRRRGTSAAVPVTKRRFGVYQRLWWLFLFVIKDKTNEHQLCQFIVGFKAAQFITLGIMYMFLGLFAYIKCIVLGSMLACQNGGGPTLNDGTACFFVLQIVIVWAAFFRLPYTERPQETALYRTKSMERRERGVFHDAFGNEVHLTRGGYLMKLCGYETVSFILIMALASLVMWLPFESWQRQALFYWIRTAYGLVSFPFLIFKIPVLANVLMHTRQMGYNEQGETVRFVKKQSE
ncbi:hypothetical protein PHYBOEH_001334 [Phytophthora boehmeriae]|uniref:Transmembrane protein n=1 Tax=Phytophthora boehmeriae TaxID=109152 RepID=A0A8T1WUB2_9STRA|nr:hypothetical protein PHYBOEH_001334 [Phytophthora boehmeriae]